MLALAIHANWLTILAIGIRALNVPKTTLTTYRIPSNCAYTPLKVTDGLVPPATDVTPTSRRTHTLLNSGTVLLQPSTALSREVYDYLATSPLVSTFSFPGTAIYELYSSRRI